jgi:riboflavin synthase
VWVPNIAGLLERFGCGAHKPPSACHSPGAYLFIPDVRKGTGAIDMFTGLIQEIGSIERIERLGDAAHIVVRAPGMASDLEVGESVAVNGTCLTVESHTDHDFRAFASEETLLRTTLSRLRPHADPVNLERALRVGERMGGHFVSGHVDATGEIAGLEPVSEGWILRVTAPRSILDVSVPKGSIAVDGISLTLMNIDKASFTVSVIPATFHATNLRAKRVGDGVNLESDLIGKHVAQALDAWWENKNKPASPGSILELLQRSGDRG